MSAHIFARGVLTDAILDYLATALTGTGILVGDGIAPPAGGWTGGEPGVGQFVPYVVVNTGQAGKGQKDPLGRDNSSWLAAYTFRAVGTARNQTDWAADKTRDAMVDYHPKQIELGGLWRVLRTDYTLLGAISRNDSVDPAYWELQDVATLWLEAPTS